MTSNQTTLERTSDLEIVVSRTFRARPETVFEAYTKPEHVRRWWAPASRGVTLVTCDADVRPGGAYRYVLERADGQRFAFYGKYRQIERPMRLVYTECFDPTGTGTAVEAPPEELSVVTATFEAQDGHTRFVCHCLFPSKEVLDGVLATGMEHGMRETYDLLDELVASLG